MIKLKQEKGELELMKLPIERGYMMKLAIAQMVLGVLIFANYFLMMEALDVLALSLYRWGWPSFPLQLVLGLAVLGCGIAQYFRSKG